MQTLTDRSEKLAREANALCEQYAAAKARGDTSAMQRIRGDLIVNRQMLRALVNDCNRTIAQCNKALKDDRRKSAGMGMALLFAPVAGAFGALFS